MVEESIITTAVASMKSWATLLDEGTYLCSIRTMYRILEEHGEVRDLSRPRFGEGLSLVPVKWKPLRPERENLGRFRANVTGVDEIVGGWPRFVSRIQGKKSVRPETAFLILAFNRLT